MKTNHHVPVLVTVTLLLLSTTSRAGNQTVVGLDPFFFNDSGWRWGAFLEPDAVEATNDGILFDVPVTDFGQWPGTANGGIGVGLDGLDVDIEIPPLNEVAETALSLAQTTNPQCVWAGISLDTSALNDEDRRGYLADIAGKYGVPCVDPVAIGMA